MTDRAQATPVRQPSRTRLSDGRELLYFDDEPGTVHDAVDRRELPRPVNLSQARWDVLTREWTVIAGASRRQRTLPPGHLDARSARRGPSRPTEIRRSSYDVVVFENRFPSLSRWSAARQVPIPAGGWPDPAGARRRAVRGGVLHRAITRGAFSSLHPSGRRTVIEAWCHRTADDVGRRPDVGHVYCFENRGEEIGVTLHHPHGQIYAYPFVPTRIARTGRSFAQAARPVSAACSARSPRPSWPTAPGW